MLEILKNFLKSLLNFLYVNKCIVCNKNAENFLCSDCKKEINLLSHLPIKIYNNVPVHCIALYDSTIKKLIKSVKFYRKKNAAIVLSELLFEYYSKLENKKDFVIIYPPAFFTKNIRRGYCHMELIAKNFSKLSNLKYEKNFIKKTKYTKPQYKVKNRKKNIEGSYSINKALLDKYKNSSFLLIDDITTSGATLEYLIDILNESKIFDITCITLAKAG